MKKTAKQPKPAQKPRKAKFPTPRWRKRAKGVWKTDLGGKLPEVVILVLSDKEFRKFHASTEVAKRYIDRRHFLKKELEKVVFVNQAPNDSGSDWIIIIDHTDYSTAGILSYQV